MLSPKELEKVKQYVLRELPKILMQDPQFVVIIEDVIKEKFPWRDDFNRLLEELKLLREDTNRQFEQVNQRLEHNEQQIALRQEDTNRQFEQVNQRLEQNEQQIVLLREEMKQRFEQVERQFEQVNQRLEQNEQQIVLLREEMNQRFEQVDRRLEQIDQRFEQVERRLEQNEQQIVLLREEMNQRFEQVDRRFEQIDRRFEQIDQRFEQVDRRFDRMEQRLDKIELGFGRLQNRAGRNLENIVAGTLRLGLGRLDVDSNNIRLRQKISDPEGLVFKPGAQKEVDIVAQNGEFIVFEVKSAPDPEDVDNFADKVKLLTLQNTDKKVQGVFIALGAEDDVRQQCLLQGLQLIS